MKPREVVRGHLTKEFDSVSRNVVVVGLGYVGLPLVDACVRAGYTVVGIDTDQSKIESLVNHKSYVDDISDDSVDYWYRHGFKADQSIPTDLGDAVYVICVPTPLRQGTIPDLEYVEQATEMIAKAIQPSRDNPPLVILESTTFPGTTEEVVLPILERHALIPGVEVHVAYSPERIDPGNKTYTLKNTPKVVGGLSDSCRTAAVAFYESIIDTVVPVSGLKEAEITKLLENTYRHVNIALANEFAIVCRALGINEWEVINAAATKPYGFSAFYPGPGVGGHCIPIDPLYLSHRVRTHLSRDFRLIDLAQEINATMPFVIVEEARKILNDHGKAMKDSRVLVLGVTYKANISDMRESPAIPLVEALIERGAKVQFHDPYVDEWQVSDEIVPRVVDELLDSMLNNSDCVIVIQPHDEYAHMNELHSCDYVVDACGLLESSKI